MSLVTPLNLDRLPLGRRLRLSLEVLLTYLRVRLVMRDDDAERAVSHLRSTFKGPPMAFEPGLELLVAWRLARAVITILERLPSDSRCLVRSLTLICMLERRGIPESLVIAVRPDPFAAHAWVEVANQAMLPAADPGYERLLEL